MLESVEEAEDVTENDEGFEDEEYGGRVILFSTYIIRAKFRVITKEEFDAAVESFKKADEEVRAREHEEWERKHGR